MPTKLHELFQGDAVVLDLASDSKDAVLDELVTRLQLNDEAHTAVRRTLDLRESQGSTGVGHGVAIPHARCAELGSLRLAYGRCTDGVDWDASDGQPVQEVFLILAPPVHVSNAYLKVMGAVAGLVRQPEIRRQLAAVKTSGEFLELLKAQGF